MLKRWTHGHSLGFGTLVGVGIATYRPWLLFAAGVAIGAVAVLLAFGGYRLARMLLAAFEAWRAQSRSRAAPIRRAPEPIYDPRRTPIPY